MLFIAEAYWDMEWTLQQQGFDLCYDKRLYDRLVHEPAESVRGHLQADAAYQERLIRFIENHDEPRAAATFAPGAGARGRGRDVHAAGRAALPRRPARGAARRASRCSSAAGRTSRTTPELRAFYERLLRAVADAGLRDGDWRLCDCTGWPDNDSHRQLVAWCWASGGCAPPRRRQPLRRAGAGAACACPGATSAGRDVGR